MQPTQPLSRRDRLEAVFAGGQADRTPILGGWIACPEHICTVAGATIEEYWADPVGVSIRAYDILGTDGLIGVFVPRNRDDFRCVDASSYAHAQGSMSLEEALAYVDAMPTPEAIEAGFGFGRDYDAYARELREGQARCGEMVWMPARWGAGAQISWYGTFGYELFFHIMGAYPERAQKLMEVGGAYGRCHSRLVARAVQDGLFPQALLMGEDICTQRGPMVSPRFMERHYAPQLRYGLEPLLEAGCKPVWHCDGDVRPILDMLLDCGVQGFQGFQPECGMAIEFVAGKRTREGTPLLIFGPLAVTTELPFCTPEQIRAKVRHAIEVCRGNADLVLFTGNTINPDVPLENILAMYEAAAI